MQSWLVVGAGDIARRLALLLPSNIRLLALCRDAHRAASWRALGALPLLGDLDQPASLRRLGGLAQVVLHFAPPPSWGTRDSRTRHLLTILAQGKSLPQRLVYISTTGVYGNRAGAWVNETSPIHPESERALRRVDAERQLRAFGVRSGCRVNILRAPGIYAAERLQPKSWAQTPVVPHHGQDPWGNHIHADDLARAVLKVLRSAPGQRLYNAVDDLPLRWGDYQCLLKDHAGLSAPLVVSLDELRQRLGPLSWSFVRESRRVSNRRICRELGMNWRYPSVPAFLQEWTDCPELRPSNRAGKSHES